MEEVNPGLSDSVLSYIVGLDSLKATRIENNNFTTKEVQDIRLRMDGLFEQKENAIQLTKEFTALYTNGPAGGGGISTGYKKEINLKKELIDREYVFWRTGIRHTNILTSDYPIFGCQEDRMNAHSLHEPQVHTTQEDPYISFSESQFTNLSPAPSGNKILLYEIAHSRAGDKGNDLNFSIIPHFPQDIKKLKMIITPEWVKRVVSTLPSTSSSLYSGVPVRKGEGEHVKVEIYEVPGIYSLNVVVRNILDGGVNCSRRIDRHGKTISDLILCQEVVLLL